MEIQAITGQHGIGKISWNAKNKGQHIRNRIFLSAGREGFKRMVKENWFGLGTLLWANFYRSAKGDRKLLKDWQIGWYNAGAKDTDFWTLYHNAETGSKKRVKFAKAASEWRVLLNLQQKLKNKGITGDPVTAVALPVWALVTIKLIVAITGLLMALSAVGITAGENGGNSTPNIEDIISEGSNGNGGENNFGEGLQLGSVAVPLLLIGGLFFMGDKK